MTAALVQTLLDIEEARDAEIGLVFVGLKPARILLRKSQDASIPPAVAASLVNAAYHVQLMKMRDEWWAVAEPEDTLR